MTTRIKDEEVVDSLTTFASLPDWLAAGMDGARVGDQLVRHVPELCAEPARLLSCTPERLRAKGAEWLARYKLSVAEPLGEPREIVLVGNLWAPLQDVPTVDDANGARFGDAGWCCWLPELRLQLRVQTSDEALPALRSLVEPALAAQLLQPILREAGYPEATIESCQPEVVRYKPGSRCTVVVPVKYVDPAGDPTPPSPVVLKTHQGDKGQTAWAAMTALWDRPLTWQDSVMLAEPLAYLLEERVLVQGPVPETRTLKDMAREAITDGGPGELDELRRELAKTGRAIAAIHRSGASYGRTATFEEELDEVREVITRLSLTVPHLTVAAEPLLHRLAQLSVQEDADPIVASHHDFRPAQVLLHEGRVGFIDFDGASMAEPALDLGRFCAKLRDIAISTLAPRGIPLSGEPLADHLRLVDELCETFLMSYQEHSSVSRSRVLLWETCDLLTSMLHAWTKVRTHRLEPRLAVLMHRLQTNELLDASVEGSPEALVSRVVALS